MNKPTIMFDTVSALKLAYLQQAHISYDAQKIIASYERVHAKIKKLFKFKHAYKDKQFYS